MQTEALAADEHTTQVRIIHLPIYCSNTYRVLYIAGVSAQTDSDEQARQVHTEIMALWKLQVITHKIAQLVTYPKFQKVTGILFQWKHEQETETLLRGKSDRRIFVTRRRHRFHLQEYLGD
jgi:hypothetical protein